MKAFLFAVVAMIVIAIGANFALTSAVDQNVAKQYSLQDVRLD